MSLVRSTAPTTQAQSIMNADVVVIGGGMAGLTAAARAAATGASVLLVERANTLGGSARFAGFVWTAPLHEVMAEVNPGGDVALRSALVDGFDGAIEWIRRLGVTVGDAVGVLCFGRGYPVDVGHYLDACARLVREHGEVLAGTETRALLREDGRVVGAELLLPDGQAREVRAAATVLATGGFQADPDLRARHLGPAARDVPLRSNPFSRGDGLRLAESAGALTGLPSAGFYGHLVPTRVRLEPELFVDLALYYSEHALLFNLAGERFIDETAGDHLTTMALLDQPEARGLLVTDARGHREWVTGAYAPGAPSTDKFALAQRRGARCALAASVAEFADMPQEWGYDGDRIHREIERVNARSETGTVRPERRFDSRPLTEPPYYAVEVQPAVTFPFTGIRTDSTGRVLAGGGGTVPGLFAAGSDTGGLYDRAYAGGLAPAVVFGLAAADAAMAQTAPSGVVTGGATPPASRTESEPTESQGPKASMRRSAGWTI
ncbi:fumarate reductase/succinate dehydrogenase flavoprotein domain protein [Parafrankia sp. EAN1pec]|uniref:FAD-dependent oxidoreductase n=1 Tax=Parafrankia sp. (strain EAN1pec) TaxID=298653 RepID=UPI000054108F|nr:fumarate reductase/succinate dehydrogenase flavoprotein domain protein [Frankia sp. EAN1pec]